MTWSIAGQAPAYTSTALATAYSDATFGENVASLVTKLEPRRLIFSRLDKSLCNKLIKHGPFVRFEIGTGVIQ